MKLRYLFSAVLSSALLFAACTPESKESFDNIKLDKTFVTIPEEGGSVVVTVNASEDWAFVKDETWPEVLKFGKDDDGKTYKAKTDLWGNVINPDNQIESRTPSWLSASTLEAKAGETEVTLSAEAVSSGREITLAIVCGQHKQYLNVRQGTMGATQATCAEILAGPDAKTYRTKGTCTAIANTTYGNWYINDGTGEVYVYGTLDAKGAEKNFASLGIEVGDVVEIEGPKTTYGSTVELVNVTVIKITKALAKVVTESAEMEIEGGEFEVKVAYKGGNFGHSVPAEYRDWLSVVSVVNKKGVASKIETNPADTAVVGVKVAPNAGGDRKGSIDFTSGSSKVSYEFTQKGSIIETTADKINAADDGDTQYRITGYVSSIENTKYGNLYIKDHTGEVYVYGVNDFASSGIQEGDIITVVGPKTSFKDVPQMKNVTLENRKAVETLTVADFLAKPSDEKVYFRLSGTIAEPTEENTKFDLATYGNFNITDETGSVYVYGISAGYGGSSKDGFAGTDNFQKGDKVTLVGYRTDYKGLNQVGGAFCVSHESGESTPEQPSPDQPSMPFDSNVQFTLVENAYDGEVKVNDSESAVRAVKLGTTSKIGKVNIVLPKGTKSVSYYAVAWKNTEVTLQAKVGDNVIASQAINDNAGATGSTPYSLTVTDSDKYSFDLPSALEADTTVEVTTKEKGRAIIFAVQVK